MLFHRNLRVQLQERRNRLYKSSYRTYDAELRYLFQFLDNNCYTRSLLAALDVSKTVDFDQWAAQDTYMREIEFPDSEEGRAKVCHSILKQCDNDESGQGWRVWTQKFSSESRFDDILRDFTEAVVDPFINYLHDRIDDGGNLLYLIQRFKLKCEWFRRKELYGSYERDTSLGEANLDQELRAFLFEGGIDYPFSQPSSPSGRSDVVALLGSEDPLVLEIKVFDPARSRDKSHLRQGFHQVFRYSNDYNQSLGYLVIFNCSHRQLVISSEESSDLDFSPRIVYGGKTFFVIPININPDTASASKESPASRTNVKIAELIGEQSYQN